MAVAQSNPCVSSNWRMDFLEAYLAEKSHLSSVPDAIKEYRRFIELSINTGNRCVPSRAIDEVWHAHILHTKDYLAFSQRLGVDYFHHTPAKADDGDLSNAYEQTLRSYKDLYGEEPNPEIWNASEAQCNGDCYGHGGCNADTITRSTIN